MTGAARRVGNSIAARLHERGLNVAVHYRSSRGDADAFVAALNERRGNSAIAVRASLDDAEELRGMMRIVENHWGGMDVLVNNASSFYPTPVAAATEAHWDDLFASNARGPFFLSQAAAESLAQHQGCIVNLLDVHAERPMREHTIYCMAKAALVMMTRSLALELAPNVRVNGVAPGAILWPSQDPSDEEKQATLARVPMQRTGCPDDIAGAVAYLALDAPYVTGQIIAVDGGRSLNM